MRQASGVAHETFFQIVVGLKTIVLSSRLVVLGNGKDETVLQGWSRTRTILNGSHGETTGIGLFYDGAFQLRF